MKASSHQVKFRKLNSISHHPLLNMTVLVAALGYFVDIYDLLLFGIVRVPSLIGLGLSGQQVLEVGIYLVNLQMVGMLLGGLLWGVIGDKRGRVSVLFGSILLYSIANILNAFISSVEAYGILRFLAGVGLAGELGAAITLVSETMGKENRGFGTTLVSSVGISGAVFAGIVGDVFHWRTCYLIGGIMGIMLLVLRLSILESGMFQTIQHQDIKKGDLRMLFFSRTRLTRYLRCIFIGVPIWFVIGILITFSPEIARELHVIGEISASKAILFSYLGGSLGNLLSGLLSQKWKSRRRSVGVFLLFLLGLVAFYLLSQGLSSFYFYVLCILLGLSTGYWVVFMTLTTEQFGTNLRATVTTTVPNFVRGSVVLLTLSLQGLKESFGLIQSIWIIGLTSIVLAAISLIGLRETFGTSMDFVER